jgi:hypothetical protein
MAAPDGSVVAMFDSKVMVIEVEGSTIRYAYRDDLRRQYEIRGVSPLDLAQLRSTAGKAKPISSSATVQYLTHVYKDSHYHAADGSRAKPCRTPKAKLLPMTPYAR